MKNIFKFFIVFSLIFCLFSINCFAASSIDAGEFVGTRDTNLTITVPAVDDVNTIITQCRNSDYKVASDSCYAIFSLDTIQFKDSNGVFNVNVYSFKDKKYTTLSTKSDSIYMLCDSSFRDMDHENFELGESYGGSIKFDIYMLSTNLNDWYYIVKDSYAGENFSFETNYLMNQTYETLQNIFKTDIPYSSFKDENEYYKYVLSKHVLLTNNSIYNGFDYANFMQEYHNVPYSSLVDGFTVKSYFKIESSSSVLDDEIPHIYWTSFSNHVCSNEFGDYIEVENLNSFTFTIYTGNLENYKYSLNIVKVDSNGKFKSVYFNKTFGGKTLNSYSNYSSKIYLNDKVNLDAGEYYSIGILKYPAGSNYLIDSVVLDSIVVLNKNPVNKEPFFATSDNDIFSKPTKGNISNPDDIITSSPDSTKEPFLPDDVIVDDTISLGGGINTPFDWLNNLLNGIINYIKSIISSFEVLISALIDSLKTVQISVANLFILISELLLCLPAPMRGVFNIFFNCFSAAVVLRIILRVLRG